jgi:hypothetical protein
VGVFLRWGIFGILSVAALVYAFNSLSHIASTRQVVAPVAPAASVSVEAPAAALPESAPARTPSPSPDDDVPGRCRVELDIARRAIESRSIGEPLDRLLRIQEIAWQEDAKVRVRLTALATRWYETPGPVDAARLRNAVVDECEAARP